MAEKTGDRDALLSWFSDLDRDDNDRVGGKNASLGEMIRALRARGIAVPEGFATTASAYWTFIEKNDLQDKIADQIGKLKGDRSNLRQVGQAVRKQHVAQAEAERERRQGEAS